MSLASIFDIAGSGMNAQSVRLNTTASNIANAESASSSGYVLYPNVNVVEEMTNMISASRSFQVNVEVMNSAKQMLQRTLTLGQ